MKRILSLALPLLLATSTIYAKELKKVEDIANAAETGKDVKYVMLLNKCETTDETWKGKVRLVLSPESYVAGDEFGIKLRGKEFLSEVATYPGMGSVFSAYTVEITPKGKVSFTHDFLDPITYAPKRHQTQLSCELGEGFKAFS